jgi:hypothetical protein
MSVLDYSDEQGRRLLTTEDTEGTEGKKKDESQAFGRGRAFDGNSSPALSL